MVTFSELNKEGNIDIEVRKAGLSLGTIFSKDFIKRFNLEYGDTIRFNNAEILKSKDIKIKEDK
jgi:signal peptidase I